MLHFAAQRGNIKVLDFLFEQPQSSIFTKPDFLGRTPLHYATESSRVHTLDLLLNHGLDIDAVDSQGRTTLHFAAMNGNLEAVQRLLELGAKHHLVCKDKDSRTPLQVAALHGAKAVVDYLQPICDVQTLQWPVVSNIADCKKRSLWGWLSKKLRPYSNPLGLLLYFLMLIFMCYFFLLHIFYV